MKKLIKNILNRTGYQIIRKDYFEKLVHINNISGLDFYPLLKRDFKNFESIVLFDIGANIGQTTIKFRNYFANSTIYSFEPVRDTFEKLTERVGEFPNVIINNFAFGDETKVFELYHREDSEWNSLVPILNERAAKKTTVKELVKVETLDNFIEKEKLKRIHLLKSDTEGFEIEVLEGANQSLKSRIFDFIYVEVGFHAEDKQHVYFTNIIDYLENYGYHFSGIFEKAYTDNYRIAFANALFAKDS